MYGDVEFSLFLCNAFIKAMGLSDDALARPIVGIANTYATTTPATAMCRSWSTRSSAA